MTREELPMDRLVLLAFGFAEPTKNESSLFEKSENLLVADAWRVRLIATGILGERLARLEVAMRLEP